MLRVNFPLVSRVRSCLLVSTLYMCILPAWLPEMMNLSSGEKQTVQTSAGPVSIIPTLSPLRASQSRSEESRELDAITATQRMKPIFGQNYRDF